MVEKSCANCLPDPVILFHVVGAAGYDRKFEAVQDHEQLFAHVLSSFKRTRLYEVVVAPLYVTIVLHPSLVNCKHCEVVSVFVVESSALLVSQLLFLSWTVKNILNRKN